MQKNVVNKKGQIGIIISIIILLAVIVGAGYAFYYVWSSTPDTTTITDTNESLDTALPLFTVTNILDTDTIVAGGQTIKLLCVKGLEPNEKYYNESLAYLTDLILNKQVSLIDDKATLGYLDRNGVLFRYVWLDTTLVNQNIVKLGYAKSDPSVSLSQMCQAIMGSETTAKIQQIGLWS